MGYDMQRAFQSCQVGLTMLAQGRARLRCVLTLPVDYKSVGNAGPKSHFSHLIRWRPCENWITCREPQGYHLLYMHTAHSAAYG